VSEYEVIYEGRVREVYIVAASSAAEAREKWCDTEPVISEVVDGSVVQVAPVDE
jgi:hypothetical protein